ncbi:MAG: alpha/beta fold hydrolase [Polyangiales bacterium]
MAPRASRARTILRRTLYVLAALCLLSLTLVRCDLSRAEVVAKYANASSQFVELDWMQVHYRDEGREGGEANGAPPLLLIHGTASSLHTWDGWVTRLSGKRRIVRLDLPGFGLTGPASDHDYSAVRLARVVVALLDRLGIPQVDVAGNSLGGRVTLLLALDHPTRVRRLVLVDAAGLSGQKPPGIFRLARIPLLNRYLAVATPRMLIAKNVHEVYGDESRVDDALVDRYYELTRREGNRGAFVDRASGPRDPDLDARLGELKMPVLILWGERDRWIPFAFAARFRDGIPGAKLVSYPTAGHVPMEELPEPTAADVDAFLLLRDAAAVTTSSASADR